MFPGFSLNATLSLNNLSLKYALSVQLLDYSIVVLLVVEVVRLLLVVVVVVFQKLLRLHQWVNNSHIWSIYWCTPWWSGVPPHLFTHAVQVQRSYFHTTSLQGRKWSCTVWFSTEVEIRSQVCSPQQLQKLLLSPLSKYYFFFSGVCTFNSPHVNTPARSSGSPAWNT